MARAMYSSPVDKLLTLGESEEFRAEKWPNYREMGLGPEHINDLILLATDHKLRWGEEDDEAPEVWAPVHAWRALGQLRAKAAIEPLMEWFDYKYDDDWITEELPQVYAMIGPPAIAPLAAYLEDSVHHTEDARISAVSCLEEIGKHWPEARDECVALLTGQLELFAENDAELNGFVIASLIGLKAIEAAPVMERAFAAKKVDLMIAGNWHDVQVDLGLKEPPEEHATRPPSGFFRPNANQLSRDDQTHLLPTEKTDQDKARRKQHATNKARHKQAKAARKKNRKAR
jgi:hypothetical protein